MVPRGPFVLGEHMSIGCKLTNSHRQHLAVTTQSVVVRRVAPSYKDHLKVIDKPPSIFVDQEHIRESVPVTFAVRRKVVPEVAHYKCLGRVVEDDPWKYSLLFGVIRIQQGDAINHLLVYK